MSHKLGNSSDEQALLRPITLWAAHFAEEALAVFERAHPEDARPRDAIVAAQAFASGKKRDNSLRMAAFAAMKAAKDIDEPSKYAARAAVLAAAVAYTHTDLLTGDQGVRQAQHILGPVVYAALAVEAAAHDPNVGDDLLRRAIEGAPGEAVSILQHMPSQPVKGNRKDMLFARLDAALR